MARRLNEEEEQLFKAVLLASDSGLSETITGPVLKLIREKSESAVPLNPDLSIIVAGQSPNGTEL